MQSAYPIRGTPYRTYPEANAPKEQRAAAPACSIAIASCSVSSDAWGEQAQLKLALRCLTTLQKPDLCRDRDIPESRCNRLHDSDLAPLRDWPNWLLQLQSLDRGHELRITQQISLSVTADCTL